MSEFGKQHVPDLSEGDVDIISSETERENAKLRIFIEDLLRQKGLKSSNVIFGRIMERYYTLYTDPKVQPIKLSKAARISPQLETANGIKNTISIGAKTAKIIKTKT